MVNKKRKRKFVFQGRLYYWRINMQCWFCPAMLVIFSEEKLFRIERALDYSTYKLPITPAYIRSVLEEHSA